MTEFKEFQKISRLSREIVCTEKIDGTNAQITITPEGEFLCGSRNRWITPEADNHGFARWAMAHRDELLTLGVGTHYGEWWGNGIQRGYGLPNGDKRWSLFNIHRWCLDGSTPALMSVDKDGTERYQIPLPACVGLVPVLGRGVFDTAWIQQLLDMLRTKGSLAAPFMNPEGIVIYHTASGTLFKKTLENDDVPKTKVKGRHEKENLT